MKKVEPTYEELRKRLTDEEIVESYVFRSTMREEEQAAAEAELKKLRLEQLKNMSDEQVLQSELMRMKLLLQDYFHQAEYIESYSFENQLKYYIALLKKSRKDFAEDVAIHPTKLSRILSGKEHPNIELMYRLELHSGKMIPAVYWYKLFSKKLEDNIRKNKQKRSEEYKRVKNRLNFRLS